MLSAISALAADLTPSAQLTFDFPELPNTLAGMVSGTTKVARLGAILPSNYAPTSKHPLFVYIKGGSGGPEDGGAMARDIVGAEEFIAVQVPLFKKNQPKGKPWSEMPTKGRIGFQGRHAGAGSKFRKVKLLKL